MKCPDAPPLAQRGSFVVGVKTLQMTDSSRHNRSIAAEVWYPSSGIQQNLVYESVVGQTPVRIGGHANRDAPFVECPAEVRGREEDCWRCWEPVWDQERAHDLARHFAAAFFLRFLQKNLEAGNFLNPSLPGFKPRTTIGIKLETR